MAGGSSVPNSLSQANPKGHPILRPEQIQAIEAALASVGEYGEVRLVVEKGRLRFLVTHKSYDMQKLNPGKF